MKRITTVTLLLVAALSTNAVHATPVTWRLKDIVFADGSTACGSYVYDAATNTYSDFRIYVSGSVTRYGYPQAEVLQSAHIVGTVSQWWPWPDWIEDEWGLENTPVLRIELVASMTDAGGTINIVSGAGLGIQSHEGWCTNSSCQTNAHTPLRDIVSGQVTTTLACPDGDSDGDGACDCWDFCPGYNDWQNDDGDYAPDACDVCWGADDRGDGDGDGICNDLDICLAGDDALDADSDGVPDACDICPGFDDNLDADTDGVPDGCDACPNGHDTLDSDGDGVPDGCDICPGEDDNGPDADGDGVPDACDACPGYDDTQDADSDSVPDDCDTCPGVINIQNITQATMHNTIQSAVDNSSPGDIIELGACVFNEWLITLNNRDITIRGQGPVQTILDGQSIVGSVFKLRGGDESAFEGLTIRNGVADSGAGGGAVSILNSTASFTDCIFENNDSGGLSVGAVDMVSDGALFTRCIFRHNTTSGAGNTTSVLTRTGATGFVNCLFEGEAADESVLGFENNFSIGTIVNCTFANYAGSRFVYAYGGANVSIQNCIFDGTGYPGNAYGGATLSVTRCLYSLYYGGGDNIQGVPTFVYAAGGDYRLAYNSLGIDAADYGTYTTAGGGATDLGQAVRVVDNPCTADTGSGANTYLDMGAYEFQPTDCNTNGLSDGCEAGAGSALEFDGVDDHVLATLSPALNLTGQSLTLEFWVRRDDPDNDAKFLSLFDAVDVGFKGARLEVWYPPFAGTLFLFAPDGGATPGTWHHWALTHNGGSGERIVYLDGEQVASDTFARGITADPGTLRFSTNEPTRTLNGGLDDVRIWNVVRTQSEIRTGMYHYPVGTETGLLGYWDCSDGSGSTVSDLTANANHGTLYFDTTWSQTSDADSDGVPDECDICPGGDDNIDADSDGVPDGCDPCPATSTAHDDCANAMAIGDGVVPGCTNDATNDGTESCGMSDTSPDVWYAYTASCTGLANARTCRQAITGIDTVLSVLDGCGGTELAANDDACGDWSSQVSWPVTAGTQYWIRVAGYGGSTVDFDLDVRCDATPVNDDCANAIAITDGSFSGTNEGATTPYGTECYNNWERDVWYSYANGGPTDLAVTVSTCNAASAFDTYLEAFATCDGSRIAYNDDSCAGPNTYASTLTWTVPCGATHLLRVSGIADDFGDFQLDVSSVVTGTDSDGDGISDSCDPCAGGAASGDTDANGSADLIDFADLNTCLGGPDGGLGTGCECFDFDSDGDVDLENYAGLQIMIGSN